MQISDVVDASLRKEQASLRKERGCTDQIFTLRNIIEQCTEWQRQLYRILLALTKPSAESTETWRILRAHCIPLRVVQIIKSFYRNFTAAWEAVA